MTDTLPRILPSPDGKPIPSHDTAESFRAFARDLTAGRRLRTPEAALAPRVLLPSHGPVLTDPDAAFAGALRRSRRLVDDPDGAVWYGARRIFSFALMIRGGIPADEVESYLHARAWLTDAARLLGRTAETLAAELTTTTLRSGAVVLRDGRLHAAAEHTPVAPESLRVPYPRVWPATEPR
ncbi:hypothetical protein [Streptomyces sp. NPDC088146]|uniref:hypothetical protein n=1 Tax=Streptomyces sp. NPDC088146 TaxID=3365829 RepID=UPI00382DE606